MEQSIPMTFSIKDGKSTEWHFCFEYLQNRFEMLVSPERGAHHILLI